MLSDELRTIAARLVLSPEHQIDGQMLLEKAETAAALDSRITTLEEAIGEFAMLSNDQLQVIASVTKRLEPNTQGQP